jgi:hypothetical protein
VHHVHELFLNVRLINVAFGPAKVKGDTWTVSLDQPDGEVLGTIGSIPADVAKSANPNVRAPQNDQASRVELV